MAKQDASAEDESAVGTLVLPAKLDLKASEDLISELRRRRGKPLDIDAGEVTQFGTHALQTLVVAARSWRADEIDFSVGNLSDAARENLEQMGLDETVFEREGTD